MRRVLARGAVSDIIYVKTECLAESQSILQQLTSDFINNPSFKMLIILLVKPRAQVTVADGVKFQDQNMAPSN